MAMESKISSFGTRKDVLFNPDHYVGFPQYIEKGNALGKDVNGRKIIKGGTIYPANDGTAVGVVLQDYDITDGDANVTIVVHGFIDSNKLPEKPKQSAMAKMPMIKFMPLKYTGEADG